MPKLDISSVLPWACEFSTREVKENCSEVLGHPPWFSGKVKATWDG